MNVLKKVKKAAVESQYAIYYYLLTEGCSVAGDGKTKSNHILSGLTDGSENHGGIFKPCVPKHIVNEFVEESEKGSGGKSICHLLLFIN